MMAGIGSLMSEPTPPSEKVLKAVETAGGRVTVADVASGAGVSLSEAKAQLTVLALLAKGDLEVSSDGELVYRFGSSFRAELSARSTKKQIQEAYDKVAPIGFYLLRVSFGVALLSSIALIFTAIFVLQNSNRDDRDRESRGYGGGFGGGGGGFGYSYWWGPSPFDFFFYNSYAPYGVNRYQDPQELSFLESVFSVLFGDGDPNANLEERRSKAVAQLIRAKGGAVTAEELAPYMDPDNAPPASDDLVDERYVLPAVTRFGGVPEVTIDGDIIYTFDDLQVSASGTGRTDMLMNMPVSELKRLAASEGVSVEGLFDKEDIVEAVSTVMRMREVTEGARPLSPYLEEQEYEFSLATSGQKFAVGALGAVNLVGALYLGSLFGNPAIAGKTLVGLLGFVQAAYPLLLAYGVGFLAVPALRYFKVKRDNAMIETRNRRRAQFAFMLKKGGSDMERKLEAARNKATAVKKVSAADVDYTSGKSIEDQGLDFKEWDKKFLKEKE